MRLEMHLESSFWSRIYHFIINFIVVGCKPIKFCNSLSVKSSFHPYLVTNLKIAKRVQGKTMQDLHFKKLTISYFFIYLLNLLFTSESTHLPIPAPWPEQFHSSIFMNDSNGFLINLNLWYDWPNGRSMQVFQFQLGKTYYASSWNNGSNCYYYLDIEKCKIIDFQVGILRPNFLEDATYLGQRYMDGFLCNVWNKIDFIWYYEDVATKRPVYWEFYNGIVSHVMTFEVGGVLEDSKWQLPWYCFSEIEAPEMPSFVTGLANNFATQINLMRGFIDISIIM
ncbi:hypothetical protein LIER_33001 [Lithospermum erythrorhizon]|uniref:Uncharacterized protein n=1 Tax=Lithospermum erythrorhizon TaxID=34254 RepID=A0AAV3RVG6_LITER